MAKRHHMTKHHSRKNFSRGNKVHNKNVTGNPLRGGIRL